MPLSRDQGANPAKRWHGHCWRKPRGFRAGFDSLRADDAWHVIDIKYVRFGDLEFFAALVEDCLLWLASFSLVRSAAFVRGLQLGASNQKCAKHILNSPIATTAFGLDRLTGCKRERLFKICASNNGNNWDVVDLKIATGVIAIGGVL